MSINTEILVVFNTKRSMWYCIQGRETFHDENDVLREWDTPQEAFNWAVETYPYVEVRIVNKDQEIPAEYYRQY